MLLMRLWGEEVSKLISEEQIERLFQNHLSDKVGSGTRKSFYERNKGMEASARTAFTHALTLLIPIIEKQMEVLEDIAPIYYDSSDPNGFTPDETIAWRAIQETRQMLQDLVSKE